MSFLAEVTRRATGFGNDQDDQGNIIEKWLNAYDEGDVNHPDRLNSWRTGDFGWVNKPSKFRA